MNLLFLHKHSQILNVQKHLVDFVENLKLFKNVKSFGVFQSFRINFSRCTVFSVVGCVLARIETNYQISFCSVLSVGIFHGLILKFVPIYVEELTYVLDKFNKFRKILVQRSQVGFLLLEQ